MSALTEEQEDVRAGMDRMPIDDGWFLEVWREAVKRERERIVRELEEALQVATPKSVFSETDLSAGVMQGLEDAIQIVKGGEE